MRCILNFVRKPQHFIFLGLLTLSTVYKGEITNTFGIYLMEEPVDRRLTTYGKGDWSRIRLSASPVISATDIVSYDFAEHGMRLRPEALARIPRPPVPGTPFVVVANGERIYLGAFVTGASSMSFAVPTIMVDRRAIVTNQPPDTLMIERAYPQPSFGVGPDPRGDPRIRAALTALGKLRTEISYVPTRHDVVKDLLWLADVGKEDVVYDLGAGDGRILISAVRDFGARKAVGIEIDPKLIVESRANAKQAGVAERVEFIEGDLFTNDFSEATVVTLYLGHGPNLDLRSKLFRTLKPGARVVAHQFGMGEWPAKKTLEVRTRYLGMYGIRANPFAGNPRVPDFGSIEDMASTSTVRMWVVPAPVAGVWSGKLSTPDGDRELNLILHQRVGDLGAVSGFFELQSATNFQGGVRVDLWGDHLRFDGHAAGLMLFDGRMSGDTIKGRLRMFEKNQSREYEWTGKREKSNFTGTWEWTSPTGSHPVQLHIERRNGQCVASYRDRGKTVPVSDFYDFGGGFYFTHLVGREPVSNGLVIDEHTGWLIGEALGDGDAIGGTIEFHPYPVHHPLGPQKEENKAEGHGLPQKWQPRRVTP